MALYNSLSLFFNSKKFSHSWIISANDLEEALKDIEKFAGNIAKNPANFLVVKRAENTVGGLVKNISIEQVREVKEYLSTRNAPGEYRIVVFYEADLMSLSAANCCLKTLEEVGEGNILFLLTSRPHSLLPTIRSRCQKLSAQCVVDEDKANAEDELMSYVSDEQSYIKMLSGKIEKEHMLALYKAALAILNARIKEAVFSAHPEDVAFMSYKFDKLHKMMQSFDVSDLDSRANFVLLVEEMRECLLA